MTFIWLFRKFLGIIILSVNNFERRFERNLKIFKLGKEDLYLEKVDAGEEKSTWTQQKLNQNLEWLCRNVSRESTLKIFSQVSLKYLSSGFFLPRVRSILTLLTAISSSRSAGRLEFCIEVNMSGFISIV